MDASPSKEVTQLLCSAADGESKQAERLMPLVYDQLRALAGSMLERESPGATLQATALVNEAYIKLVDQTRVDWKGKSHFFAIGATIMRRILVDYARSKRRQKRGGGWHRVELAGTAELSPRRDQDVLAVDEALEKLKMIDPTQARIVELRFFGGLTVAEVAEVLRLSKRKVEYEWQMVRAWLRRELDPEEDS